MTPINPWSQWGSGQEREGSWWRACCQISSFRGTSGLPWKQAKQTRWSPTGAGGEMVSAACCGVGGGRYKQPLLQHHSQSFPFRQTLAFSYHISPQFSSASQLCPILCDPMDCSMPGLPVHHQLPEFTQTHVHRVSNAIQPSHPMSSTSPRTFNLSQHQGLFQWVGHNWATHTHILYNTYIYFLY